MKPLDYFAPRNDEWLLMARSISPDPFETLQEAYLKLHSSLEGREEMLSEMHPNQLSIYMWLTLKSCAIAVSKENAKYQQLDQEAEPEHTEYQEAKDITPLMQEIEKQVRGFHWYDEKLFRLHYEDGLPMREIARQTNISLSSIFHTLKTCRNKIKNQLNE